MVSTVAAADSALCAVDQVGQRVGVQQRHVARGDHDDAVEVLGQRGQAAADGVAGAELLFLHRDLDRAAQLVGQLGDRGRDPVAVMADHDHEMSRCHLGDRVQRVRQHAAAGQRVQHLRGVRPHAGAGPGGQDQDRGLAVVVVNRPPCASNQAPLAMVARQASLRRQDSNLNYLNQNQRCCRLHHDGLINS